MGDGGNPMTGCSRLAWTAVQCFGPVQHAPHSHTSVGLPTCCLPCVLPFSAFSGSLRRGGGAWKAAALSLRGRPLEEVEKGHMHCGSIWANILRRQGSTLQLGTEQAHRGGGRRECVAFTEHHRELGQTTQLCFVLISTACHWTNAFRFQLDLQHTDREWYYSQAAQTMVGNVWPRIGKSSSSWLCLMSPDCIFFPPLFKTDLQNGGGD